MKGEFRLHSDITMIFLIAINDLSHDKLGFMRQPNNVLISPIHLIVLPSLGTKRLSCYKKVLSELRGL